jgi:surfactin synthase thioesterase subunit
MPLLSPWLSGVTGVSSGGRLRLFCFAHAGGGPSFFRPWQRLLPPHVEVCPVTLPGRESRRRELPYTRMARLIPELHAAVRPYAQEPFALLGHSLGAIVAYELARCFTGDGGAPVRLFVSGRRPPGEPATHPPLHRLPDADFLAAVNTLGGTPQDVIDAPEVIQLFLPALRADFELNETYSPLAGPALTCPVSALTGDADPEVSPLAMSRWREKTSGPCSLRVFPGAHFYLKGPPPPLLTALTDDLRLPVA